MEGVWLDEQFSLDTWKLMDDWWHQSSNLHLSSLHDELAKQLQSSKVINHRRSAEMHPCTVPIAEVEKKSPVFPSQHMCCTAPRHLRTILISPQTTPFSVDLEGKANQARGSSTLQRLPRYVSTAAKTRNFSHWWFAPSLCTPHYGWSISLRVKYLGHRGAFCIHIVHQNAV